jgi:hypothetical protein
MMYSLEGEHHAFAIGPPGVAAECAGAAEHAVAGNEPADGVSAYGIAHGA